MSKQSLNLNETLMLSVKNYSRNYICCSVYYKKMFCFMQIFLKKNSKNTKKKTILNHPT